ncbi:CYFA0S11e03686g1_1 [Cyberlindnera fabianii]|uniref:Endoplasmic reticulum transmembrane protein n=1 Tax=Cyberlindnera fabianii TaxID=36022 RepID=A0A061B0G1_CYBFA|nr:Endoplasmic reticulum transmembrane protein 3 [Cyberlindnera fabianii]CDR43306.1 CYFA0S11e03686g1_1 [Cyberlindnera fabianii]
MALYYNLVFALLVLEMALFTVLSLPLPSKIRRPIIKAVSKPFQSREVTVAIRCILVFILILFVDSVNRVQSITEELRGFTAKNEGLVQQQTAFVGDRSEIQARRFYAQRNLYLTGFTLFLTLIVSRTYGLVAELLSLKEEVGKDNGFVKNNETVASLEKEIKEKDEELTILKSQADSLRKDYDDLSEEVSSKTTGAKA